MGEEMEEGKQSTTAAGSTNMYRYYVEFLFFFVKAIDNNIWNMSKDLWEV